MITHAWQHDLVVFNIGMTVHKPHRVDLWGPVFGAMPRMLRELEQRKAAAARGEGEDLGFLGAVTMFGTAGPWVTQYWRSPDQLYAYATASEWAHLPAWRAFNKAARKARERCPSGTRPTWCRRRTSRRSTPRAVPWGWGGSRAPSPWSVADGRRASGSGPPLARRPEPTLRFSGVSGAR